MELHNVQQGSQAWHALRAQHFTASEAPAMMGVSPFMTRTELLRQKSTGIVAEVDAGTQRRFDAGHDTEAKFRPLAEEIIGDDLYPCTGTRVVNGLALLASFDGLTISRDVAFEHKLYRDDLAKHLDVAEEPPEAYIWQLEQQLLVSGAERVLFVTSDGTGDYESHCWYESKPERRAKLIAGWKQFSIDLANFTPTPVEAAAPVGRAPDALPALHIEVTGMVTASNLAAFKDHALTVFKGINRELSTDADFADAEKTVKWCGDVEDRLKAAKDHAQSQAASIDELFRTIDAISAEARTVRLELDKLVKSRKEAIKGEIVAGGAAALREHIASLNTRIGKPIMPIIPADFGGVVKGKRTVDSLRNAVDTELARAKIEASAIADRIQANLAALAKRPDMAFLFADVAQIALKASDDFAALVENRIAAHEKAEADKLEAERARIRAEEQARADREAQAKLAAAAPPEPVASVQMVKAPAVVPLRPVATTTHAAVPTLRLGVINERLAPLQLTADGLATLGFTHSATDKAAKLYYEHQFAHICAALVNHIESIQARQAA